MRGFTLIEVLVCVAIITLLLSILLPALGRARDQARSAVCLSQLRQLTIASQVYANTYAASYPPATDTVYSADYSVVTTFGWDFTSIGDVSAGTIRVVPGLLWQGRMAPRIQQCPAFPESLNVDGERPYTGYNYNSSYVGAYRKRKVNPARQDQIRRAERCALFGDGEYIIDGVRMPNNYMRSPWGEDKGARDYWVTSARQAGTQGYRHLSRTNVAFADGHAESRLQRYTETYPAYRDSLVDGEGYLSKDNSMYSLDGVAATLASSK